MTCAMCDEVKGLESFAKTQRGDPDNAVILPLCTTVDNKNDQISSAAQIVSTIINVSTRASKTKKKKTTLIPCPIPMAILTM